MDKKHYKLITSILIFIFFRDVHKSYDFNIVLDASNTQAKVYARLNIN
jgi:hypothetical protein